MNRVFTIILFLFPHCGLSQNIYFEPDTLKAKEIIFQDYIILAATDTISLFETLGHPLKVTTYQEEDGDIEFAEFHYHYDYAGFDIRLFIADSLLYFGNLTITTSLKSLILRGEEVQIGDPLQKLALMFPISYQLFQTRSKYLKPPFTFLVYFINDDLQYGYYGSIMFEIEEGTIQRMVVMSMIE